MLEGFYRDISGDQVPIVRTNFANAELAKMMYNTFMMTKVTFANQWAQICEKVAGSDELAAKLAALRRRLALWPRRQP